MNDAVETIKDGDFTLEIFQDESGESPREWDNLGKMICFHRRYRLGDKHSLNSDRWQNWSELRQYIIDEYKPAVILSLYLYDHSVLRMKVGSFQGHLPQGHAEFDSGQVGFIFATKEAIQKEYGVKRISKQILAKAVKVLEGEVKTYDQYLQGDVYSYTITKTMPTCKECGTQTSKVMDSVGGFYGFDETLQEVKSVLEQLKRAEMEGRETK